MPKAIKKNICKCKEPQRCNNNTGLIGYSGSLTGLGQCNLCHKCLGLINPKFDVVIPLDKSNA